MWKHCALLELFPHQSLANSLGAGAILQAPPSTRHFERRISLSLELLSSLVSSSLNQAATWSDCGASIPSVNFTPVMTLAK